MLINTHEEGYKIALKKIQESKVAGILELDLSNLSLKMLPEEIQDLDHLISLNLRANELTNLPKCVKELKHLTSLNIIGNKLMCLPEWIKELTELKYLFLRSNQLIKLPIGIEKLGQLISLDISYNLFTSLPEGIKELRQLTSLYIRKNDLMYLPDGAKELTRLMRLDISYNNFTHLPNWIHELSQLMSLNVRNNNLIKLPGEIEKLTHLSRLQVSNNQLTRLPKEIVNILDHCELSANECPLIDPPLEIVEQGNSAIRQYFKDKMAGTEELYEAKLMIVGEPGAGKTTLALKLLNPDSKLPKDGATTRGIDVNQWRYKFDGELYSVNLWDFGGQEILQSTHQFFLSRRALYILLADSRKNNTDYMDWLHRIRLFAGNSPVMIVHNEKDDRVKEINLREINQRFPGIAIPLRCNLKDLRGYDELIKEIHHQVSKLELIGTELPNTWVNIRRKIEEMSTEGINYISEQDFFDLCDGFDQKGALILSQYLHDIGVILHFQNDGVLKNIVIINPEWGTDAVYKVIETPTVQQNYGRFSVKQLIEIWSENRYQGKFHELLQLMMNFKLCYEIPSEKGTYILPQLLPYQPQDYPRDTSDNLVVQYRYDYLLKSIIVRFIVATHELIDNHHNNVWRNGVVLHRNGTHAEIVADEDQRQITIKVSGFDKKEMLSVIMHEFETIHTEFYKEDMIETMVPCNCQTCKELEEPHLYRFSNLKERLRHDQYTVGCDNPPYVQVDINFLIEDSVGHKWVSMDEERELIEVAKQGLLAEAPNEPIEPPEIFISYAWAEEDNSNGKDFIDAFEEKCKKDDIHVRRDVHDVRYKDRVSEYMEEMGRGKAVLVILSKKYLHSRYCMHELVKIAENKNFYNRVFPVILEDANIHDPISVLNVAHFWESEKKNLQELMKDGDIDNIPGVTEWLDRYAEIRLVSPKLLQILGEMANTLEWQHTKDNMDILFAKIKEQLAM